MSGPMQVPTFDTQPPFQPPVERPTPTMVTRQGERPLSDTDYKTYCYVILRDLMIAGGFLMGCASFFLIVINPAFVLGIIPAVALAILGIKLPLTSADAVHGTPPKTFIPGQPLGLYNEKDNCWLNSALQLTFNLPCLSELVRKKDSDYYFGFLQKAQKTYEKAQQQDEVDDHSFWLPKSEFNSQTVRKSLYDAMQLPELKLGSTQIESKDPWKQEDPIGIFNFLVTAAQIMLPLRQESHNYQTEDRQPINVADAPAPDEACFDVHPGSDFPTFDAAWAAYFNEETANGSVGEVAPTYTIIKKQLTAAPEFFVMHLVREYGEQDPEVLAAAAAERESARLAGEEPKDMPRFKEGKNRADFDVPQTIKFTEEQCPSEQAGYRCTGFITHWGITNGGGHYISCLEKEGRYWLLNDQQYPRELTQEEYQEKMKQGSVFIYEKN